MRAGVGLQFLMWRPALFVLLLVPLAIFLREQPLADAGGRSVRARKSVAGRGRERGPPAGGLVWVVLVLAGLIVLAYAPRVSPRTGRVLLDARGEFSLEPLVWGA